MISKGGSPADYCWEGTVRADVKKDELVLAGMTCQFHYGFPYTPLVENLGKLDPDRDTWQVFAGQKPVMEQREIIVELREEVSNAETRVEQSYPVLLRETTSKEVRESFTRVNVNDVKQWAKRNLPDTLASRRRLAYAEAKPRIKQTKSATSVSTPA